MNIAPDSAPCCRIRVYFCPNSGRERFFMNFDPDSLDGRDPEFINKILPYVRAFNKHYVRLNSEGLENIPRGPAMYVSNHNCGITSPDFACTLGTLWDTLGAETPLYGLTHDFVMLRFTNIGRFIHKLGALRAANENAYLVLASGGQVLVYPGGDLETFRHSRLSDTVIFGPRTGFVRVAQQSGVPIVPIVVQGAHRSVYIFDEGESIAKVLNHIPYWKEWRVERFPLALALPWGLAVGPFMPYLPLPFKIRMRFLPPVNVAPDDDPVEAREHIRSLMQTAMDELAKTTGL
jgi:1-acyl-sn-glycerol-3-phosphate acyltransferase